MASDALIVLDIGKTNAKLALVDAGGRVLVERRRPNTIVDSGPYPHHDVEAIWDWMQSCCRAFGELARVSAIVPVTHGATAALVGDGGLVLPVLDYEAPLPDVDYEAMRPPYSETYSPSLPAGLNLGRQLVWLEQHFPEQFAQTRHILMYPQYWAWRLCGRAAGEATSLGCHTDLWNPLTQRYSSLVECMGWEPLMPEVLPPSAVLGRLLPSVAAAAGLPEDCVVVSGIHDSNASLMRYLRDDSARTVLSTGTWMIAAAFGAPLAGLHEDADMLANTSALGKPVACMRFMGGREFAALAGEQPQACSIQDVERLIAQGSLALPCFAEAGGPFAGRAGRIEGPLPQDPRERYALATLYCVLMTDYCLDALQATGPLAVEGSFTANPLFGPLLSALRPQQPVSYSDDASGTVCGAWMLRHSHAVPQMGGTPVETLAPQGLFEYRQHWIAALS